MRRSIFAFIVLVVSNFSLLGCVSDRMHQPVVTGEVKFASSTPKLVLKHPEESDRRMDTNHATVEFKESGELWDDCSKKHENGTDCQLLFAEKLIGKAREDARTTRKNVVVVTFVHGNRNNASEGVDNYKHFRQILNCLNLGTTGYSNAYGTKPDYLDKTKKFKNGILSCGSAYNPPAVIPPPVNSVYVGIYIGWRGRTNFLGANVREGTAYRISNASSLVGTLYALRDASKVVKEQVPTDAKGVGQPARFIVIGHSFGGLMVEKAASDIYMSAYRRPSSTILLPCGDKVGMKGFPPFTDQVFTVSEAVNSVPAVNLIKFFQARADQFCFSKENSPALKRPLLVALLSKHDVWNLSPVHSAGRHILGPDHGNVPPLPDDKYVFQPEPSPRLVRWDMPARLTYIQNLCYLSDRPLPADGGACDAQAKKKQFDGPIGLALPNSAWKKGALPPVDHLYVKYDCSDQSTCRDSCANAGPGASYDDLHVWNRTPYWIAAIDKDVMSGHDDFWNPRFVSLLQSIGSRYPVLSMNEIIPRPEATKWVDSEPGAPVK